MEVVKVDAGRYHNLVEAEDVLRRIVKAAILKERFRLDPNDINRSLGRIAKEANVQLEVLKKVLSRTIYEIIEEAKLAFDYAR